MKKLDGIVIVKETIVDGGYINEQGKVIAPTKEKFSAKPKRIAEDYVLNDPTAEIVGDAYEVFDLFEGRRRRRVLTKEEAEQIGTVINPFDNVKILDDKVKPIETLVANELDNSITEEKEIEVIKESIKTVKAGRKPKAKEEIESEKENFSDKTE